jgi:hypothetical protein
MAGSAQFPGKSILIGSSDPLITVPSKNIPGAVLGRQDGRIAERLINKRVIGIRDFIFDLL